MKTLSETVPEQNIMQIIRQYCVSICLRGYTHSGDVDTVTYWERQNGLHKIVKHLKPGKQVRQRSLVSLGLQELKLHDRLTACMWNTGLEWVVGWWDARMQHFYAIYYAEPCHVC